MSAADYNPCRKTKGWDAVQLPPANMTTDIYLKGSSECSRKLNSVFGKCKTCSSTKTTSFCSRCKTNKYCGQECQRKDWAQHEKLCATYKKFQFDVRVTDNFAALMEEQVACREDRESGTVKIRKVGPIVMTVPTKQLKWTRTKWDAAREFYWYAQNNYQKQACPYLNLRETPWDFSDPFALWIIALTQEANGQWEWKGE